MASQSVDHDRSHQAQARRLLWPVALAAFVFTVSYPANDFATASKPSDIGLGMFLVYAVIAAATAGVVFGLILAWALRKGGSGRVALALAIVGALFAPGFWTGVPPALAAGGALLGWAGLRAQKDQWLSRAAFGIGVIGVVFNVVSYAAVFI